MPDLEHSDRGLLLRTFEAQGAKLHDDIIHATQFPESQYTDPIFHSGLLRGVKRACDLLHGNPLDTLTDKIVTLPDELADSVAARALVDIVNTSYEGTTVAYAANFGPKMGLHKAASCMHADGHFSPAISMLAGDEPLDGVDNGALVIRDGTKPLFLLKNHEEPTSMSLAPFTNHGVLFPAGMLCNLKLKWEIGDPAREDEIAPIDSSEVYSVVPTRLLAHAFPLEDRNDITDPDYMIADRPSMGTSQFTAEEVAALAAEFLAAARAHDSLLR